MIREAIDTLVSGRSLDMQEAASVMGEIMEGEATPAQLGAFLTALRLKGETVQEIAGMATVMREKALRVEVPGPLVDSVGTGGDGQNTFNISTAAAFVAAATNAAAVEILNVSWPSPPVPTESTSGPVTSTRKAFSRMTVAIPAISSAVSPLIRKAVRKAPNWAGVASPSMISPITVIAS